MNNDPFPQQSDHPGETPPSLEAAVAAVPAPPSVPMPAPEIVSSKKKVVLSVIAALVIAGAGIGFYGYHNRGVSTIAANGKTIHIANQSTVVEQQFLNDIFVGNFKGAYSLTSTDFKNAQRLAAFTSAETPLKISQLTVTGVKVAASGKTQVVTGVIMAEGHRLFAFSSNQVKQGGTWHIDNLAIK